MKFYVGCFDGQNNFACYANSQKEACKLFGISLYNFRYYGASSSIEDSYSWGKLPEENVVFYRPISDHLNEYPWRKTRYHLRYDENRNSYYE